MSAHDEFQTLAPASVVVRDGKVHLVQGGEAKFKVSGAKVDGKAAFALKQGEPLGIEFVDGERAVITQVSEAQYAEASKTTPKKKTPAEE